MTLPYLLHNNGIQEIVTVNGNTMHTVLTLALKANPAPAVKAEMEAIVKAIEDAWERSRTAQEDADYDWEH